MPAYIVRVTLHRDGALLPPITAMAIDEQAAIQLVRDCGVVDPEDTVETRGPLRDDVMIAAFGNQPDGTIVIRGDWIWMGNRPQPMRR
jgi:hypothetical protein